jgi:tetratricopeptide (TPR) repeat protein
MISRTRRLTLPLAALLALAGCGAPAGASIPSGQSALGSPSATAASSAAATDAPSAAPAATPTPAATLPPTQALIEGLTARVDADPDDAGAQRDLGLALLQRIRETADPSLYGPAEAALTRARDLSSDDVLVLVGLGALQLGRHEFALALETGKAAVKAFPDYGPAHGVVVDALVELGRYKDATVEVQRMVKLSTDLPSLARLSYVRELHGDLPGALEAMREAADAPGLAPENTAYVTGLLGNLLVANGDPDGAKAAYEAALQLVPNHAPSIAGLGRLAVGRGDLAAAAESFERASAILPLPEYVIALGEVRDAAGDHEVARQSFDLARAEITLFQANGVTVDLELALFEADHGDPVRALELAEAADEATPTVRAADAVAWALHRLGRDKDAKAHSDEATRLGSKDPLLRYHAGAIAAALGDSKTARHDLELSLATDPGFSAAGAAEARRILADLP